MKDTLYTIGHSNRKIDIFLKLLNKYNIRTIIDVRRFPTSKKYPWFSKDELNNILSSNDIKYIWLGEYLGGYREGGYVNYMNTDEYSKGIKMITEIISSSNGYVTLLCSEKLWFKCHRRFISDTLTKIGYKVIHIVDEDKVYPHKLRIK